MPFTTELFGTLPDGRRVERFTLKNENGVTASFTDLGAIWLTMLVPDRDGVMADVVLGYDTVEKCTTLPGHLGEPVGRNANRIANGTFTLNDLQYILEKNSGENNLHSGPDYYRDRVWKAEVEEEPDGTKITFALSSPDGDQGYPGNADIVCSYTLTAENSLIIHYQMTADQDTIANFTNHAYFNLAGHGSGSAMKQKVWIDAEYFTIADQNSIPTGELVAVAGTPMDFTEFKEIGKDIDKDYEPLQLAGGYDHNWVLNHPQDEISLCAKAVDEASGRCMEVYTDLPGLQFYTANSLNNIAGKDGAVYQARNGYCFETQYYPDAINKPQFPSPVLKAGAVYDTTTVYKFTVK